MSANPENTSKNSAQALHPRVADADLALLSGHVTAAASLYRAAVADGIAAAAERLAVLAAAGVGRDPSWPEAIGWLVKAADMGHLPSQSQICALAGQEMASVEGGWLPLARRIDLKGLLTAPPLRRAHESPAIALIEGLATPTMCDWLIHRAGQRLEPAKIGDYATGNGVVDEIRTGLAAGFGLADTDVVLVMTQKRLELASGLHVQQQEAPHVLSYEPGQEYKAHFDFFAPGEPAFQQTLNAMGQRVATCLTWLSDDYDGGETAFLRIGWQHKGRIGDAMLFLNVRSSDRQPDPMTLHAGKPVTRGRKWLLSQWVRDRAQPIV